MAGREISVSLTMSGADLVVSQLHELSGRVLSAGSVEEVERRIGRELDEALIGDLVAIEQSGTDLRIEATPEFYRVMAALDA